MWICATGPVIGCTPTISLAITVGITRRITGRITRFSVATLPTAVAPLVAVSIKCFLVFSKIIAIVVLFEPCRPSNRASLVSFQRPSNSWVVISYFSLIKVYYYFSPAKRRISITLVSDSTFVLADLSPVTSVRDSLSIALSAFTVGVLFRTAGRYLSYAA